jgi:hypothetical protein
MRATQGDAWQLIEASQTLLAIAAQPLADGFGRGVEEPGGRLDAIGQGLADDPQAEIELVGFVGHSSYLFKIVQWFHQRPSKIACSASRADSIEFFGYRTRRGGGFPPSPRQSLLSLIHHFCDRALILTRGIRCSLAIPVFVFFAQTEGFFRKPFHSKPLRK